MQESNRKDLVPTSGKKVIINDTRYTLANVINNAMQSSIGYLANLKKDNIIAKAKLKSLKQEIEAALEAHEHQVDTDKEAAIYRININSKITLQNITNVYENWLKEVGGEKQHDTVKFMDGFAEKTEKLKDDINKRSRANPQQKEKLIKVLDKLWEDMFSTLFKEAAVAIQNDSID